MPNQEKYREISSCSNFLDFQARRSKIRSKDQNSSTFLHTLNGSALAVGRTLIAIIENCFDEKSNKILIPECLKSYFGDDQIIL
jgi:seryl-tRNA synthetase